MYPGVPSSCQVQDQAARRAGDSQCAVTGIAGAVQVVPSPPPPGPPSRKAGTGPGAVAVGLGWGELILTSLMR